MVDAIVPLPSLTSPVISLSVIFTINYSGSPVYGMGPMVLVIPSFRTFQLSRSVWTYYFQFLLLAADLLTGLERSSTGSLKLIYNGISLSAYCCWIDQDSRNEFSLDEDQFHCYHQHWYCSTYMSPELSSLIPQGMKPIFYLHKDWWEQQNLARHDPMLIAELVDS